MDIHELKTPPTAMEIACVIAAMSDSEARNICRRMAMQLDLLNSPGARDIAQERQRQLALLGWTPEHDDQYTANELVDAAICYADAHGQDLPSRWPWDAEWWKPEDRLRELAKAGALIAAEIDRIKRMGA